MQILVALAIIALYLTTPAVFWCLVGISAVFLVGYLVINHYDKKSETLSLHEFKTTSRNPSVNRAETSVPVTRESVSHTEEQAAAKPTVIQRSVPNRGPASPEELAADKLIWFLGQETTQTVTFIDMETNGLQPESSVLSCSAVKCTVDPLSLSVSEISRFNRYYFPRERINRSAVAVNGLTWNEISKRRNNASYPKFFSDDLDLKDFLSGCSRVVAHNAEFDLQFIPFFTGKSFCTMRINTNIVRAGYLGRNKEYKWPTLAETASHYEITVSPSRLHTSEADAEMVREIFRAMLRFLHDDFR